MNQTDLVNYIKENMHKVFDLKDDYVINCLYSLVKEALTFDEFGKNIKEKWAEKSHLQKREIYNEMTKTI